MKYREGNKLLCLTDSNENDDNNDCLYNGETYIVREVCGNEYEFEDIYYYEYEDATTEDVGWCREFVENPDNFRLITRSWKDRYK